MSKKKDNVDIANSGEILFVKCVKDGIPNRDPLRDSDARRIFGDDDGRISLSDVSIKRDVRDFVLSKYPDGDDTPHDKFVFVQKKFNEAHTSLLGRDGLAKEILERTSGAAGESESDQSRLMKAAYDVRIFGAVFSVKGKSFNQTGPVQFGWAHSLHPVETKYTQGTVVMPSKEAPVPVENTSGSGEEEKGKTQGTIWTQYHLPFAVFAMPAVINSSIAKQTGMTTQDKDLLLESLWKGTLNRQARGRGIQQPLFLCHIEYTDPFFRIGFLDELVSIKSATDSKPFSIDNQPTRLNDIVLDLGMLAERLTQFKDKIASVRIWANPSVNLSGENVDGNKVAGYEISNCVPEELEVA